ncbi:MAG: 1-deoxy-D-xylulose-5-phosphate synthase [Holosporales bacterium]|jgi:1-deoxy-D-xylulose-5-phosphate synthase|nr:1-deoxy-D-xylulose-5-phosphate synthase [Holosporales bacterium]
MLLDSISSPLDLRALTLADLTALCAELRDEIIRITRLNGGHLGSNLGSIELIVAAHFVFECPTDRFIFDVGHQAYSHKLLTGRRKIMENLRKAGGASGFPDPSESVFDHFIAGHASTALSAAVGIAKARDLKKLNFRVISRLGDGSMSGGMVYEAMNNSSGLSNFIVILNDNQMSISESVGSMRTYLSRLMRSKKCLILRKRFRNFLNLMPTRFAKGLESVVRNSLAIIDGNNVFEELGFHYIGPVDGHNLQDLIEVFRNVRDIANYKPVIIHAITQKGKGYKDAENDITRLHGLEHSSSPRYTDIFGNKITELAESDERIVCITAAMKNGCGLVEFEKRFPERFFDVGIAEEHAVTFAAGLAKEGLKPFVCIYSTFLQRAFDQILHDVILQNLPVRFIIDKAGFPGPDGKTHAGLSDIALLQNFNNIVIEAPSSRRDLEDILELMAADIPYPIAVRFPKATAPDHFRPSIVPGNSGTLVISTGDIGNIIHRVIDRLESRPTIWNVRSIKPFDFDTLLNLSKTHQKILVIEEGVFGGVSNIILEKLIAEKLFNILRKIEFISADKDSVQTASREEQMNPMTLKLTASLE